MQYEQTSLRNRPKAGLPQEGPLRGEKHKADKTDKCDSQNRPITRTNWHRQVRKHLHNGTKHELDGPRAQTDWTDEAANLRGPTERIDVHVKPRILHNKRILHWFGEVDRSMALLYSVVDLLVISIGSLYRKKRTR